MDERVLRLWEGVADRERREKLREMIYAVRIGMNADKNEYTQIMHDLKTGKTSREKAKDTWEELKLIGGG